MNKLSMSLAIVLSVMIAPAVNGALYKWVDEEGNVVYSDRPPTTGEAQPLKQRGSGITDEESEAKLESLRDKAQAQSEDREIKEDVAKQLAERDQTIKENCAIARKNKSLLETPARVTLKDADGNDYFLSEEERADKLADTASQVERYCE